MPRPAPLTKLTHARKRLRHPRAISQRIPDELHRIRQALFYRELDRLELARSEVDALCAA
jgi:hypothetical protein